MAYIGRRASHLFGAYNVNQADIFNNGFLDAFGVVKGGGESQLMNQLLAPDTRRQAGESGSAMVRRLFASELSMNSVAAVASSLGQRIQSGRTLSELAGLGSNFFFPVCAVPRGHERHRFRGLLAIPRAGIEARAPLCRRLQLSGGLHAVSLQGHAIVRPAFTVVGTGNAQSATSTPFNIFDRDLNYAPSDFDRTHVLATQWVWDLPFGQGRRFGSSVSRAADVRHRRLVAIGSVHRHERTADDRFRRHQHVVERRPDAGQLQRLFVEFRQHSR